MSTKTLPCRFCANETPTDTIINLKNEKEIRETVIEKLSFFSVNFVDFNDVYLPESVCGDCIKNLDNCYTFFRKVKESQAILCRLFIDGNFVMVKDEVSFEDEPFAADTDSHETHLPNTWTLYTYLCPHCKHTSTSLPDLREHTKTQHGTCYGYRCADCNEKVDLFEDFVKHVRSHRVELRKYCEYCNIKMEDNKHVQTHLSDHCCTFCGETFLSESDLLSHLKLYVSSETGLLAFDMAICDSNDDNGEINTWSDYPSICKYCKTKLLNKDMLTYHCMEVHETCFGMQCVDCETAPSDFMGFVHHVGSHRPELKLLCPYCEIKIDETDIQSHLEKHTTNQYPCFTCGEIFNKKRSLTHHELKTQSHRPRGLKTNIQTIKRKRGPITVKDLTCDKCGIILKTSKSMKVHKLLHTERQKSHTCEKCGLTYYTKGALTAHKKTHENFQKITCKICQKTLSNVIRLRKHLQTHNLEKPFQCDHCLKFFSSKDRLRPHMITHMNIKPYSCLYCDKKFKYPHLLKIHENLHTGAKPYICEVCCMEFSNWSNCNKHMKRKHGKTLAKTVMTPQGRILINPKTGKPQELEVNNVVKEWSENILKGKRKSKESVSVEFRLERTDSI